MKGKYSKISELEIYRLISDDDLYAFEYIYKKYHAELFIYASRFIKNKESAKEIIQDLFLNLWEKRKTIHINTSLKSYLYSSVKNRSINYLRNNVFHNTEPESADLTVSIPNQIERNIYRNELEKIIHSVIDKIPEKSKIIFWLSRKNGWNYKKIAEELDISVKSVEYHIGNALKSLRKHIKKYL